MKLKSIFRKVFPLSPPAVDAQLDEVGLTFVKNAISAIEKRGELHNRKVKLIPDV